MFEAQVNVSSAYVDRSVKMGAAQTLYMMQDGFTESLGILGCGNLPLRKKYNCFWVVTKSKVAFSRMPDWGETIRIRSFFSDMGRIRANINTEFLDQSGQAIITGTQEICVLDFDKHRPQKLETIAFPAEGFSKRESLLQFEHFPVLKDLPICFEQAVYSQHIDMSHHVNNVEYVKMALNAFSSDLLLQNPIISLEAHYLHECREGSCLQIRKQIDGKTAFLVIACRENNIFEMKLVFSNNIEDSLHGVNC